MSYVCIGFVSSWKSANELAKDALKAFGDESDAFNSDIIGKCFNNAVKYVKFEFGSFGEVLLQVEKIDDECVCLLFNVDDEWIDKIGLDLAEAKILDFMKDKVKFFDYAFCDHEAHLSEKYSILVKKNGEVELENWRVDGLNKRL